MMNLRKYLEEHKIWHEFYDRTEGTSAADASRSTGIDVSLFGKSMVVLDEEKNGYIIIVPAEKKLSFSKVKDLLGVKKVHFCAPDKTSDYSGYEVGATAPLHYKNIKRVVIDKYFTDKEFLAGGGGIKTLSVKLKVEDVIRFNQAVIGDVCE